jgi:sulfate/thiosulfate transport system ATP-binding protein
MSIILDQLTKWYGSQLIVDQVGLEVQDGELFVLLGASGSGKSTILRLIAGLAQPDNGRILLHGRDVTDLPPQQRGVGFVFQNYSIFRHMNVAENIEFGLRIRRMTPDERAHRREQLLDLVGLAGLGSRYADQLSGGQQQRVALARALAYQPRVLLLDEPFGALDVKIRSQLRRSLKKIQQQLGVTTILVTHDQEEAFELAERIGVIEQGRLLEVGPPEVLYTRPKSAFVATFLGVGTVLVGQARDGRAQFGPLCLPIPADVPHEDGDPVQVLVRPEQVALSPTPLPAERPCIGRGTVIEESFSGAVRRVRLRLPRLPATRQIAPLAPFGEEGTLLDATLPAETPLGQPEMWVGLLAWHILKRPPLRLLVYDNGQGSASLLVIARQLVEGLVGAATVLGVAPDLETAALLRAALQRRQREADLTGAELRLRTGDPVEQIGQEQAESVYDFLLLPANDQLDLQGQRLSSTVVRVLKQTTIPVLVNRGERKDLKRLLICTAAGEPGKLDVRIGGRLARRLGAAVTLLYVSNNMTELNPLTQTHLERAAATLRALDVTAEIQIGRDVKPVDSILAEARAGDFDLIVMGEHGPEPGSIFGLDDVTLQVLAAADRPVLVVPSEETAPALA